MFKQHKFWADVMVFAAFRCVVSGLRMVHPGKREE